MEENNESKGAHPSSENEIGSASAHDETVKRDLDPTGKPVADGPPSSDKETVKHRQKVGGSSFDKSASSLPIPREVFPLSEDPSRCLKQYILVEEIGKGGMGSVWRSWDTRLVRWVAIKFLSSTNDQSIRRFEREAQLSARLRHPNIASIHEVNEDAGRHFLVMDYIDGSSIGSTDLEDRDFLYVYVKVCRAVHYAHVQSIVHRDIKPENILMGKNGEPYVTDFGLAKVLQTESSLSLTGSLLGTPVFMSPEQAEGRHSEIDARSDVYSLGATLYALLTGHAPFEGEDMTTVLEKIAGEDPVPATTLNPDISSKLEAILLKAMCKEKGGRYATASDFAQDLENYLEENKVVAKRPGPMKPLVRKVKRRRWQIAAVLSILLAGGVWVGTGSDLPFSSVDPVEDPQEDISWKKQFRGHQRGLSFYGFEPSSSPDVQRVREILLRQPESASPEVVQWFASQMERLPDSPWPKKTWLDNRVEAKRIEMWCGMILEVLEGMDGAYVSICERLQQQKVFYSVVAAYAGTISVRFSIWPYAEIRTLRVGDSWVIQEGGGVSEGVEVSGESLHTPLEIRNLDIGEYVLVLFQEDVGEKEVRLKIEGMKNGEMYVCSGSLEDPDSIRLSLLP